MLKDFELNKSIFLTSFDVKTLKLTNYLRDLDPKIISFTESSLFQLSVLFPYWINIWKDEKVFSICLTKTKQNKIKDKKKFNIETNLYYKQKNCLRKQKRKVFCLKLSREIVESVLIDSMVKIRYTLIIRWSDMLSSHSIQLENDTEANFPTLSTALNKRHTMLEQHNYMWQQQSRFTDKLPLYSFYSNTRKC